MKHFKNILVVINEEDASSTNPAFVKGVELAERSKAKMTLMSVLSPPTKTAAHYKGIFKPDELLSMMTERLEDNLKKLAERASDKVEVETKVASGKDFIEIIRQVIYGQHDLLLKVANEHEGSFDSSDFHLMRKSPVPVWLLKAGLESPAHRVLATIDLDQEEEGEELNETILEFAASIAKWEDAELHILSCWSLYGENTLRDSPFVRISTEQLNGLLEQEENDYTEKLANFVAQQSLEDAKTHLIKGDPAETIPKFAEEQGFDVVVMGTVARTGIPGLLIGNTAESILHKIDSSVITLKPSGFETIIK